MLNFEKFAGLILLAIFCIACSVQCNDVSENTRNATVNYVTTTTTTTTTPIATENNVKVQHERTGRIMKYLKDSKPLLRRTKIPPRIRSRADHFPPRPMNTNSNLNPMYSRTAQTPPQPQMLRRVQNGLNGGYQYDKSSRYSPVKVIPGLSAGKVSAHRHVQPPYINAPQGAVHPNAVHLGAGVSEQYIQNFKASPAFNGKVIVHQVGEQSISPVQQHPIPSVQTAQQFNEQYPQQLQYLNQREQYNVLDTVAQSKPQGTPVEYQPYNVPAVKPYQQPIPNYNKAPAQGQGYSVYEDDDIAAIQQQQHQQHQQPQPQQSYTNKNVYRDIVPESPAAQEAQDYLKFMSTNEYFLPKREPNYKQLDAEHDHQQYYQQQQQQQHQQQLHHHQQQQQQQQQQFIAHSQQNLQKQSQYYAEKPANNYNEPIQVSNLFHHNDPAPSSTIVRGSYQAGNNAFVVSSDGNRAVKHFIPDVPKITTTTTATPPSRYNQQRHRTPEPQRFEFTERDAVHSGYTKSPNTYLRYKAVETPAEHQPTQPKQPKQPTISPTLPSTVTTAAVESAHSNTDTPSYYGGKPIKPVNELDDDAEDSDDVHGQNSAGSANSSEVYGRIQLRTAGISSTTEQPIEQKDTEDYCERICANVQDDDEEVVCGSDGYMYTSEAQLECYSSCLHIEVSIQGKGSCSAR